MAKKKGKKRTKSAATLKKKLSRIARIARA
jgi:hypothetical protein